MTDIIAELKNARAWAEGYRDLAALLLIYLDNVERLTPDLAVQLEEQIARKRPATLTLPWDEKPFPEVSFLPDSCGCSANGAVCEEGKRLEAESQRAYEVYVGSFETDKLSWAIERWTAASQAWYEHVKKG